MSGLQRGIKSFGLPRLIIAVFLISLFFIGGFTGTSPARSVSDVINRFGMNGILVLSMVPMIQSGCGLNFGLPVGIVAGLLGAVISLEFQLTGPVGILAAILIAAIFAVIFGFGYGALLNRVKGDEMIIATYVGYSLVYLMSLFWIILPFKNPSSVQGFKGEGLRTTISVGDYWGDSISGFLNIKIGPRFTIPTGMILVFAIMCLVIWLFFKTRTGTAITAVGSNPEYARAAGININKMRIISVIFSTVLAAIGIIIYQQSFGFIQLYNAPLSFHFPAVAAVLLGGASVNKASIPNVIIGTILFQGVLTMTPSVINSLIAIDASDVLRIIVTNGLILYALTRKVRQS